MNIRLIVFLLFVSGGLLLLAACGGGSGAGDPAQTVEQYLQAKADGDADTIRALLCADMEQFLERESRTFDSVSGVHIDGMVCTRDGSSDVVRCEGKIVATYGTEDTEFPLTSYRVVQEDGEWKWCGEAG
ncbi:MAG: hypothetical protein IPJ94_31495 [Chloroflexi bacterium]|nr:hypothetical protein [Chloroflexota bacterium]